MDSSVKLLGIEIDNKLNFKKHISNICEKASSQPNAVCRLQAFMNHKEKEAMINTSMHSNFSYSCPFDTSVLKSPKIKLKKFMKGV